ncbi:unnamed protein product [Rhizoctonia solani]|uniref:Uncharacterized protein n=1 Tax=Rhizoctonia solani TaxID=456999 RepID=A0A8H3AHI5_9AGAM|nr:unnamed protein product [Rhizoctonia solani]
MESPLFKSFSLGFRSVQQAPYAPSNYGLAVHPPTAPNNTTSARNPSALAEENALNRQAHQILPYYSTPSNTSRTSGTDLPASTDNSVVLMKHTRWLPCAMPGYREASYPRYTREPSYPRESPMTNSPEDWVIVNVDLRENDSHA